MPGSTRAGASASSGNAHGWHVPGDGPRGRRLRRFAAVLVALGVLVVIYRADAGAWHASREAVGGVRAASHDQALELQFERVREQLQGQVPRDHTIYLDLPNDPSGLWKQRIGEFAAMSRLYLVSDRAKADYVVTLATDPSAPDGVRLVARPAR